MNRKALITALIVTAVGGAMLWVYTQRFEDQVTGGELVEVLVAKRDIEIDMPITRGALGTRTVPKRFVERHIRAGDLSRVEGVRLRNPVRATQSVLWSDLQATADETHDLASNIRRGLRALSIPVRGTSSFGGLLRPGDSVDVLLTTTRPGSEKKVTVPLLQMVLVLAVGADLGTRGEQSKKRSRRSSSATLLVSLEQAALLTHAMENGGLHLVLRNPNDVEVREKVPDTTDEDLIEAENRSKRQRRHPKKKPQGGGIEEIP